MEQSRTYDAFISYRNLPLDATIASTVQRLLETLHVADQDGKKGHALRIFRDKSDLPVSDDLSNDVEDALRNSRFLILICSRQYKESVWCMREVKMFQMFHGSTNHILPILIDGTPAECFPSCLFSEEINALGEASQREPLAANICADSRLKMWIKLISTEYLRLAAPIVGAPFAKLYQRKKRERIALSAAALSIIMAASIGFGIYNNRMLKKIEAKQQTIYAKEADRLADLSESEFEKQNYPLALMLAQRAVEYEIEAGNDPEVNSAAGASLRSAGLQIEYEECNNIARTRFIIPYAETIGDFGEGSVFRDGTVIAFCNLQTVSLYDTKTGALLFQTEGEYAALDPNAKVCVVSDTQGFRGYRVDTGECYFSWNPDVYIQSGTFGGQSVLIPIWDSDNNVAYLLAEVYDADNSNYKLDTKLSAIADLNGQVSSFCNISTVIDPDNDYSEQHISGTEPSLETIEPLEIDSAEVLEAFEKNEWEINTVQTASDLPFYIILYKYYHYNGKNRVSESRIGIFDKNGKLGPYIFDSNSYKYHGFQYIGYKENTLSFWYTSKDYDYIHIAELVWGDTVGSRNPITDALKSNGYSISGEYDNIEYVAADASAVLTLGHKSGYSLYTIDSPDTPLLEINPSRGGASGSFGNDLIQIDKNLNLIIYATDNQVILWSHDKGIVFSNSLLNITSIGVRKDGEYSAAGFVSDTGEYLVHFYNAEGYKVDTVELASTVYYIEIAGDYVLIYTEDEDHNGNYNFYQILQDGRLYFIRSIAPTGDFKYKILPYMLMDNGLFLNYYIWDLLQLGMIYQVDTGNIVFNTTCSYSLYQEECGVLIYEKGMRRQVTSSPDAIYAAQYDAEIGEFVPLYSILNPKGNLYEYNHLSSSPVSDSYFLAGTSLYSITSGYKYMSLQDVDFILRQNNLYPLCGYYTSEWKRIIDVQPISINAPIESLMQRADEYLTSPNGKREFSQSEREMYYIIDY